MILSVALAAVGERPLIEGLSRFYVYDFSEMEPAASRDFEFDDRGDLGTLPGLDAYWAREGFHPLVIRLGVHPIGFALVNTHSHQGGAVERNMGEFFIARKHRRRGLATAAIHRILSLYPGEWEVAVVERNLAAKTFWPRAIASAPNIDGLLRIEGDGEQWRGPIWCFTAAPPPLDAAA
jgi:predicted acetyltransferase